MKIGKLTLRVFDPIFKQRVVVMFNRAPEEFRRWEKSMNVVNSDEWNNNTQAFTTHISAEGEPNTYVIFIRKFEWSVDDQATLIHELIHVVTRIWDANNIEFSPATQEFFAHSVDQFYSDIVVKILNAEKRKKR